MGITTVAGITPSYEVHDFSHVRYTADFQEIKLTVPIKNNTVWLNRKQLAELFGRDVKTIGKHINNALKEELDNSVVANFATTASDGKVYQVEHYNLAIRFSILYRLNIEYTRFPIFPTPSVLF